MKLRRSVILAFCVIVVLATAGILIAYNFRAAMFDRTSEIVSTAPEPEPAEELKEPQEEEPIQAETAAPPSSITAEEQIEPPAKPQVTSEDKPDDGELSVIPEAAETEESIETASESTLTEPTAISDTESNEPEIHNLIAEYDILGYSLSAGGPIVSPMASMIVVTPVCPHTLTARSIVLSGGDRVRVHIGSGRRNEREEAFVTFDGDVLVPVNTGDYVDIRRSEKTVSILKISRISFLEVLRNKMRAN